MIPVLWAWSWTTFSHQEINMSRQRSDNTCFFISCRWWEICAFIALFCLPLTIVLTIPSFNCQMCRISRSDLKVNFLKEKKKKEAFEGVNRLFWPKVSLLRISIPPPISLMLKHAKTLSGDMVGRTVLSCQLFGIMPWQIRCVPRFLSTEICSGCSTPLP